MNKEYTFKDAFMILKAIEKTCKDIYDSKSEIIVRQLENTTEKQYRSDYGLFNLKTNAEKTIKEYTEEEKAKVEELQAQINILQAQIDILGTEKVVKESYNSLVYRKNGNAEKEANELLKDLIDTIGNATMKKAASKQANIK